MIYWIKKYFSAPRAHWTAFYEVAITAAFALAPFLVTYFVESAKLPDGKFFNVDNLVGRGQLYLLSYGLFGSLFWLAFMKDDKPRHGARVFLGLCATLAMLPAIGYIGVDPTFSSVANRYIVNFGYILYFILLFINYLLLFYMNISPPEPQDILDRETLNMRQRYEEMRRG
jgi:predicted permease